MPFPEVKTSTTLKLLGSSISIPFNRPLNILLVFPTSVGRTVLSSITIAAAKPVPGPIIKATLLNEEPSFMKFISSLLNNLRLWPIDSQSLSISQVSISNLF